MVTGYLSDANGVPYDAETFDLAAYVLEQVDERLLTTAEGRRTLTRLNPLLFTVLYMPHLISDRDGRISFADLHLDLCRYALAWILKPGPREARDAFVAPRECGKSSWLFKALTCWAGAHGHKRFIAAFSSSASQAEKHLAGVKRELDNNQLLREDYPELCQAARRPSGGNVADTQQMLHTQSGFSFAAKGLDSEVLGLVDPNNLRPDLLLLDDVEPDESNYSAYQAKKRLVTICDTVMPMNEAAHVALIGTVTMPGSIVHQLVKTVTTSEDVPQWITDERFRVHYFWPIVTTNDGRRRSIWPVKWPLEYLEQIEATRSFKKNFLNQPVRMDGDFWTPEDFVYGDVTATKVLLQIDPAVTDKKTSDYYGVSVIAYDAVGKRCAVRYARQFKLPPAKLRDLVLRLLEQFPEIGAVRIETNQGGDTWRAILHHLPVRLLVVHESAPKAVRAAQLLNHYQRGRVVHAVPLPDAEQQMTSYPDVLNDDLIDAIGAGVRFFLDRKPIKSSAKSMEYAR